MNVSTIVSKVWSYCNLLYDDCGSAIAKYFERAFDERLVRNEN